MVGDIVICQREEQSLDYKFLIKFALSEEYSGL